MKNKRSLYAFVLILVIIAAAFLVYKNVYAASGQSFGGKVGTVTQCTCSTGSAVNVVGGRFSGTYLYIPGTRTGGTPRSGKNILGTYRSGGTCMVTGNPCTSIPITRGTITYFGMSK